MLDHAHAGTGRTDDRRVTFGKGMHEVQRDRARFIFKPIVEERLSAAGLFGWKKQLHAQALQEMSHVSERGGVELVTKTGNEKLGFWHYLSLV